MSSRAFTNDAQRANAAEVTPNATHARANAPSLRSALGNRALLRMAALRRSCECGGASGESCGCDVEKTVRAGLSTPSHAMEPGLQRQMESHFGHDFSGVRIHRGDLAAASAHNVQAAAYTVGNHIVFGHNAYTRDVLAHELTHVVQQGGDATIPTRLGDPHDALEHEANAASANVSRDEGGALRRTPAKQVSCAKKTPLVLSDGTSFADPVAVITAAETLANQWLDEAIAILDAGINSVSAGQPAAWPTIGDATARAVALIGLDPSKPSTWTTKGLNTVALLRRRLELVRKTIGAGSFFFFCDGTTMTKLDECGPASGDTYICDGAIASTCAGKFTTALCKPFWKNGPEQQAQTILHESLHNLIPKYMGHKGREGNVYCYQRAVTTMVGTSLADWRAKECPNP